MKTVHPSSHPDPLPPFLRLAFVVCASKPEFRPCTKKSLPSTAVCQVLLEGPGTPCCSVRSASAP